MNVTTNVEWYDEHVRTPLTIQMSKTIRHLIKEFHVTCWFTVHKKMGEYDFGGDCGKLASALRQGIPVCDEHA